MASVRSWFQYYTAVALSLSDIAKLLVQFQFILTVRVWKKTLSAEAAPFPLHDLPLRPCSILLRPLTAPPHPIFGSLRSVFRWAHMLLLWAMLNIDE